MSDDYDTDLDSEQDEFERENLIDDIKKIQLALAESDVDDDDEEEDNIDFIETSSFKNHHRSFTSSNIKDIPSSDTKTTLAELVPITTDNQQKELENTPGFHGYHSVKDDGNQSESFTLLTAGSKGCQGNLFEPSNDFATANISNAGQYNHEISSKNTVNIIPIIMETNDGITQQQAIYNFATMQQSEAGYLEEVNDIGDAAPISGIDIASLDLREVIELSLMHNKDYQSQILKELQTIDLALLENKKKQFNLNQANMEEEDEIQQALPTLIKFSYPYFKDCDGHGPPFNEDGRQIRSYEGIGAYQNRSKAWNLKEEKLLAEGVRMQNLKNKLSPLLKSLKEAQGELNVDAKKVALLNKQIKEVRELPLKDFEQDLEGLNWEKLSSEFLPKRRAIECELHWCHFGHPRVNKKPWTIHEDKMLLHLAKNRDDSEINWNDVAQTMQTNRTPIQCYQRFQRSLNKKILRSKWTPEEDEQLTELVKIFGQGNWQRIADYLDGRMGEQCMHRYMKACRPGRKGRWSDGENEKLMHAVQAVGQLNWEKVAELVPGRTGTQCRERFVNVANPTLNKGPWEKEEDTKLLALVERFGTGNWAKISKEIQSRTDNQCWRRWNLLRKEDSLYYRLNTLRKKREMVANFVGRRQEKPMLRPEDLDIQDIPIPSITPRAKSRNRNKKKRMKKESTENTSQEYEDENQGNGPTSSNSKLRAAAPTPPREQGNVTSSETGHVITSDQRGHETVESTSPKEGRAIKRRVSESSDSDEEWNEIVVIDTNELGTRTASTRKRRNVNYAQDDGFVSDVSQDDEIEEDYQELDDKVELDERDEQAELDGQVEQNEPEEQTGLDEQVEQNEPDEQAGLDEQVTQIKRQPPKRAIKSQAHIEKQNTTSTYTTRNDSRPPAQSQVQGSVASFSLLLQAFNINVSGVLQKVKPASSQHALETSVQNLNTSTHQSLSSSTPNKDNSCSKTSEKPEASTGQRSLLAPVTPNKDNSEKSLEKSETLQTTGQQSSLTAVHQTNADNPGSKSPKESSTQTPGVNTGCVTSPCMLRSSSKRKAKTPRKTIRKTESKIIQPSLQVPSVKIENIQSNDKVLSSIDVSNKSVTSSENERQGGAVDGSSKSKKSLAPVIPPLPPCLTTLKGLQNLLSLKRQLEMLAHQGSTRSNDFNSPCTKDTPKNRLLGVVNKLSARSHSDLNTHLTESHSSAVNTPSTRCPSSVVYTSTKTQLSVASTPSTKTHSNVVVTPITNKGSVNVHSTTSHLSVVIIPLTNIWTRSINTPSSRNPSNDISAPTKGQLSVTNTPGRSPSRVANTLTTRSPSSAVNTPLTRSPSSVANTMPTRSPSSAASISLTKSPSSVANTLPTRSSSSAASTPLTRSPAIASSTPVTNTATGSVNTPTTDTTQNTISCPSLQRSKRVRTEINNEPVIPHGSKSGLVINPTSRTVMESSLNETPCGIRQPQIATTQSSSLASLPRVDPRFPQDPFLRYSLYRKSPEYNLLAARFNSLFLWPLLMSKVPLVGKIPRELFRPTSRQNNWGFPHMFALPVTPTSVSFNNPHACSVLTETRPTNPYPAARLPGNLNSATSNGNSRPVGRKLENNPNSDETAVVSSTVSEESKSKTTEKTSGKTTPNSRKKRKRDWQCSSTTDCEEVISKKMRQKELQNAAQKTEQGVAKVKYGESGKQNTRDSNTLPEDAGNTNNNSSCSKRRMKKKTFSSDFIV